MLVSTIFTGCTIPLRKNFVMVSCRYPWLFIIFLPSHSERRAASMSQQCTNEDELSGHACGLLLSLFPTIRPGEYPDARQHSDQACRTAHQRGFFDSWAPSRVPAC